MKRCETRRRDDCSAVERYYGLGRSAVTRNSKLSTDQTPGDLFDNSFRFSFDLKPGLVLNGMRNINRIEVGAA